MTEMTSRFALPLLQAGQAQKELYHNEALALLDLALHLTVRAIGIDLPPPDPEVGDCWIVGGDPKTEWLGRARHVVGWTGGGWRFVPPTEGMLAWCVADALWVQHIGDTWIRGRVPAESVWIGGKQVIGAQHPAIAPPSGGTVVDAEARSAISAIIGMLRSHGLIGS